MSEVQRFLRHAQGCYLSLEREGNAPWSRETFSSMVDYSQARLEDLFHFLPEISRAEHYGSRARVLDLGCGVQLPKESGLLDYTLPYSVAYEYMGPELPVWSPGLQPPYRHPGGSPSFWPTLCRLLHLTGHSVVGVDAHPAILNETFPHLQRDLINPGALADLESSSFDLIVGFNFCSGNSCPTLWSRFGHETKAQDVGLSNVESLLEAEAYRLLKPGGALVLGSSSSRAVRYRSPTVL